VRRIPVLRRWYILLAALALLVATVIWPTPYREYRFGNTTIRVNRLTGRTDLLTVFGWEPQRRPQK
jgi:hypothetical protein